MRPCSLATFWSLTIVGLLVALAVGCGTAAPPTERPQEAVSSPTNESMETATPESPATPAETERPSNPKTVSEISGNAKVSPTETPAPEDKATSPAPTATPEPVPSPTTSSVGGEPDWARELKLSGINTGVWETDFSKRSVSYSEIFSGGVPRDGIPPIYNPEFVAVEAADQWLEEKEPVIALEINGVARAYPLQILTWHEIVNDTVAGVPVAATFCPLCNSAIVFDRRLDGVVYDFGVSGNLRNSDLIMWDHQTQSWWQQLTGEAIVGQLTGERLDILPATIVAWQDFVDTYPEGQVLSRDTGHRRSYGSNPYVGYDEVGQSPFLFFGEQDDRLLPTERVAAVTVKDKAVAFPFAFLEQEGAVNYQFGEAELVVLFKPGVRSALDQRSIADSREVGSTGIFLRDLDGQDLTFAANGEGFVDQETGTTWSIFGQGIAGPHAGRQLAPVPHANHFWFAWAAFRPDTLLVREVQ